MDAFLHCLSVIAFILGMAFLIGFGIYVPSDEFNPNTPEGRAKEWLASPIMEEGEK